MNPCPCILMFLYAVQIMGPRLMTVITSALTEFLRVLVAPVDIPGGLPGWHARSRRGSLLTMTTSSNACRGFRFLAEVIQHAVWLYHCFSLSQRDIEPIVAARHRVTWIAASSRVSRPEFGPRSTDVARASRLRHTGQHINSSRYFDGALVVLPKPQPIADYLLAAAG